MAIWALTSSALFMSNDLANVPPSSKAILTNRHVLAVNQDPAGRGWRRFRHDPAAAGGAQGWSKELVDGAVAVALYNPGSVEVSTVTLNLADLAYDWVTPVDVFDFFAAVSMGQHAGLYHSPAIASHGTHFVRVSFAT
jgi:alpha-galactosidase